MSKLPFLLLKNWRRSAKKPIPIMVSGTLTDTGGRTLQRQTVEAFYASVHHGNVISVGLVWTQAERNASLYQRMSAVASCAVSAHIVITRAHSERREMMAARLRDYLSAGLLNIVGGCCGNPYAHCSDCGSGWLNMHLVKFPNLKISFLLSGLEL